MKSNFLFIFLSIVLIACGKTDDEKVESAIYKANLLLSSNQCQAALNELAGIAAQPSNYLYVSTLASAYACRADFSSYHFFTTDLENLDADETDFLNSLSIFSSSTETQAESDSFLDMQDGIDTLMLAGSLAYPEALDRISVFGAQKANDLHLQSLYMLLAQMGKWFHYYGGVNTTTGIKSGCLYSYTNGVAQALIDGNPTGACANPYTGVRLSGNTEDTIRQMCYPVVLYNNLMDVLINVNISSGDSNYNLDEILDNVQTTYEDVCTSDANMETLCSMRLVQDCVDEYAADNTYLQVFFAGFFEASFL